MVFHQIQVELEIRKKGLNELEKQKIERFYIMKNLKELIVLIYQYIS